LHAYGHKNIRKSPEALDEKEIVYAKIGNRLKQIRLKAAYSLKA
jgi:hypothetical protein